MKCRKAWPFLPNAKIIYLISTAIDNAWHYFVQNFIPYYRYVSTLYCNIDTLLPPPLAIPHKVILAFEFICHVYVDF